MEFKYLNTFRTIVETGSFTAAAEKLNYTQSTITFQIGQLEQELSVKLFEKIGRRMVLTKAGDHLIPYVDEVMRSMNCYDIRNELLSGTLDLGLLYEEAGGFNGNLVTDSFGKYPLYLWPLPRSKKSALILSLLTRPSRFRLSSMNPCMSSGSCSKTTSAKKELLWTIRSNCGASPQSRILS